MSSRHGGVLGRLSGGQLELLRFGSVCLAWLSVLMATLRLLDAGMSHVRATELGGDGSGLAPSLALMVLWLVFALGARRLAARASEVLRARTQKSGEGGVP